MKRCLAWCLCPLLVLAASCSLAAPLRAQETPAPLSYRRVLVPEEELDEEVQGLLPIRRSEFERRLQEAAERANPELQAATVSIERAEYRARLAGDCLVSGGAELSIASRRDGPGLLSFGSCNLAISRGVWQGLPPAPATLGTGSSGRMVCLAPASGRLEVDWTLRGKQVAPGKVEFIVRLPPATGSTLFIETPQSHVLTTDRGHVEIETAVAAGDADTGNSRHTFRIEIGGASQVAITAQVASTRPPAPSQVLVRESAQYAVQLAGIDADFRLNLEGLGESTSELLLEIDGALDITSVSAGDELPAWTLIPGAGPDDLPRVRVVLPAVAGGGAQQLRVQGVAPWDGSKAERLPRVRVLGATWQEGQAMVSGPAFLELDIEPLAGARQTQFVPAANPQGTEQFSYQYYLPTAGLVARSAASLPTLVESSGTDLAFERSQVLATHVAEITAARGQLFEVRGTIPRQWIVDSVDVQPAEWLEDRVLTPTGASGQTLRLALRRAVPTDRPLRVVIKARMPSPPVGEPLPADAFPLASFQFAGVASRRLVAIFSGDSLHELNVTASDESVRLDPDALSATDLRLFESPPAGAVLATASPGGFRASLRLATSRMKAQIHVFAALEANQARQVVRVRCEPESTPIGTVTVHVQPPLAASAAWRVVGEPSRELAARVTDRSEHSATYELQLQRPRSSPFEITTEATFPLGGEVPVVLPSVPSATDQRGSVDIHDLAGRTVSIRAEGPMKLAPPSAAGGSDTLRGALQFEPGRPSLLAVQVGAPRRTQSLVWIEHLALYSRFSADGAGQHQAVLRVRNSGERLMRFALSPQARDVQIKVNGSAAQEPLRGPGAADYSVSLPGAPRTALIEVEYLTTAEIGDVALSQRFFAPLPQFDTPVLASEWQVDLAPGWSFLDQEGAEPNSAVLAWLKWPAPLRSWWSGDAASGSLLAGDGTPSAGWTSAQLPLPAGHTGEVAVYRPAEVAGWGAVLLLGSCAVAWRLGCRRPLVLVWVALGMAALAPALSPVLSLLCLCIAAGVVAAAGGALCMPVEHRANLQGIERRDSATLLAPRMGVFLALLAGLIAGHSGGAPPASGEETWRRVVIPIDGKQQPTGDYVFIDPELYDGLLALTDRSPLQREQWILSAARYSIPSAPRLDVAPAQVDEIQVAWEVETLAPQALVKLRLARTEVHLLEGRARLDDQPVTLAWSDDGQSLEVPIESPGKHRLELAFRAAVAVSPERATLDLAIPRSAASEVRMPAMPRGEVVSAAGAAAGGSSQLGSASRLQVHWHLPGAEQAVAARLRAEQAVLWRIRPGSVVANVRLRVEPLGGPVKEVALRLSPQLRPLPVDASQPVARQWLEERGEVNILHLELVEPIAEGASVQVSLLWAGSSGVGKLLLPAIDVQADEVTRSWEAAVVSEDLTWERSAADSPGGPTPAELAAEWGDIDTGRSLAWRRRPGTTHPVEVRPAAVAIRAEQTMQVGVARELVRVRYEAALSNVPPGAFRHRLLVATPARVTRLVATSAGQTLPLRWSQDGAGQVTIFLAQSPPAQFTIELEATRPLGSSATRLPLPVVRYQDAALASLVVHVLRESDSLVKLVSVPKPWKRSQAAGLAESLVASGRWLFAVEQQQSEEGPPPVLQVQANRPSFEGALSQTVLPSAAAWQSEVFIRGRVTGGVLDELRLTVPRTWDGPFEITPAVEHRMLEIPGEPHHLLVIRPQAAWTDEVELSIRGPLESAPGAPLEAPEISLVDAPETSRYLMLPRQARNEAISWDLSGLQAAELAQVPLPDDWRGLAADALQVVGPRYSAIARLRQHTTASPQVALADYSLFVAPSGSYWGLARFDLQPGALRDLTLELAPGCRLVAVGVEGIPVQLQRTGSRSFAVPLVADRVPQRLEAVFSGSLAGEPGARVGVPGLRGLPAERTLWAVSGPASGNLTGQQSSPLVSRSETAKLTGLRTIAADEASLVRQRAIAELAAALAAPSAAELPRSSVAASFRTWHRRFQAAGLAADREPTREQSLARSAAERRLLESGKALVATGTLREADLVSLPGPADEAAAADGGAEPRFFVSTSADKQAPVVRLSLEPTGASKETWWPAWIFGGLVATFALFRPMGLLAKQPAAVLAAVSLALIVSLPASWIGWVVLGLAVYVALRFPWPRLAGDSRSGLLRTASPSRPGATRSM